MDWTGILKSLAPTVATALAGPLGGVAVNALGGILGIDQPTIDNVADAFEQGKLTPDHIVEIKKLELDYQNQEKERGFKYAELAYKEHELDVRDKDGARQMQIATHSKMPAILTSLVTVGFFSTLWLLFKYPDLKSNEIVLVMVGQLSTVWAGCVAFYTGTTFNSANKNAMIAQK